MMGLFKKHPVAVILSVIFHLALIGFFVLGVNLSEEKVQTKPVVNVVKATAIDESKIKAEASKLKELERQKKLKEQKRLDDLKKKRLAEEKKLAELKKKQADEKRLAQKKAAEAAKQAKIKKQKALEAKKKAEDAKKKKLADAKKLKERLAKEEAKKVAAAKEKASKAKAAKAKAAKAKAAKEQAAKEQAAKEQAAKEQAKREQALQALAAQEEQENRDNATTNKFVGLIIQKVERNWIQPPGDISGLSCVVRVRLIPGGEVVDAQVIQSSGNTFFDRSVELATRKAAPLPLPSDPNLFGRFRTLEFYFRPGG